MSNPYEQFQNQKALARIQRRHHGADTTLDDAEERYEVIFKGVMAARYWHPIAFATVAGIVLPSPSPTHWWVSLVGAAIWTWLAAVIGGVADAVAGWAHREIRPKTENIVFVIGGVALMLFGALAFEAGPIAAGLNLALTPITWRRWARKRLARTDYARLKAQLQQPRRPPRIIE